MSQWHKDLDIKDYESDTHIFPMKYCKVQFAIRFGRDQG